jgi:molybdopterin synthase catalytic subunit
MPGKLLSSHPSPEAEPVTVRVQKEDFDVGAEMTALRQGETEIGAVVSFVGTVRGTKDGQPLSQMELEHYPGMTEQELERIQSEAHKRWTLTASRIVHRVGTLRPGDQIVLVLTASAHRQAAFEAAQFIMDFLKSDAPFWKKETSPNGTSDWVSCRDSDAEAKNRWS